MTFARRHLTRFRILARLELAQAARFLRQAARDPALLVGLFGLAIGLGVNASGVAGEAAAHPHASFGMCVAAWACLARLIAAGGRTAARLLAGPFQPLVADRNELALWLAGRAFGWQLVAGVALSTAGLVRGPAFAAAVFTATVMGGLAGSIWTFLDVVVGHGGRRRGSMPRAPVRRRIRVPSRRPATLIAWVHLRRGTGFGPTYVALLCCLSLAASCGWLATRNSGADVGAGVMAVFCLPVMALAASVDQPLVQFLGHQPSTLAKLLALWIAPIGLLALAVAPLGLIAGVGSMRALLVAAGVAVAAALVRLVMVLHGLTRSVRTAPLAASLDIAVAVALAVIFYWTLLLAPIRLVLLTRRASRTRWLTR